jgi:hypothetical protein
MTELLKG